MDFIGGLIPFILAGILFATFGYLYKRFIGKTPVEKFVDKTFDKVYSYVDSEEKIKELNIQVKENGYYDYWYFNPEKNVELNKVKNDLAVLQFFRDGDFSIDDELKQIEDESLMPFIKKHNTKIKSIQDGCLVLDKIIDIDEKSFALITISNGYQIHEMVIFYHLVEISNKYFKIWSSNINGYQSNDEKEMVYQLASSLRECLNENSFIAELIIEKAKYINRELKHDALIKYFKKEN